MRRDWVLAALLVIITIIALPTLTYPLGRDQGEFATIGRGILNGRVPYVELWNPKPPAVFYFYAAAIALFGQSSEAIRAIDLIIVPLICAGLFWLGNRLAGRQVGLWAALIFAVFYFSESFWTLTQNDGIVLLPMALAMICMFKASEKTRRSWPWALVCGALCALTLWFKYPFALFVAAVVFGYLIVGTKYILSLRIHLLNIFAFVCGGLLIGLGGIAYLAAMGAWDALVESAQVTSSYTTLTLNTQDFIALMGTALGFRWSQWGLLLVLVAAWPVLVFVCQNIRKDLIRQTPIPNPSPEFRGRESDFAYAVNTNQKSWSIIWVWALAGLAIMLVQAKGYDYHWLPMLPPLALIAGDTLTRLIDFGTRYVTVGTRHAWSLLTIIFFLGILLFNIWPKTWPYLSGQETQVEYYAKFQAGEFVADESLEVANLLRERVVPGDSLFIWGFRPEVYYLSKLNPATRFIFQFPLVADWYPAAWKEEAVDTLWAAMPPYVLVLQVDYMPWVTGRHEDSNTLLQAYTDLNSWLIYNYEPETQIGNFFVWRRKATQPT